MKELSIEEKAKAYDNLVERLKDLKFAYRFSPLSDTIEEKFPELKESEDGKIRNEIIEHFKEVIDNITGEEIIPHESKVLMGEIRKWITWLEKQGEQKPTIIVPKFRVGDEICWKGDIDNNDTIAEICDGYYLNPLGNRMDISYTDTNFELVKHEIVNKKRWTINDAKNGDMLSYSADDGSVWLMIFQSEYKPYEGHLHYHALLTDELYINGTCCLDVSNLRLSNEEERKMLFKEIQKDGYVWDSYGLELKKVTQPKQEWSKEDENIRLRLIDYLYGKSRLTKDREDGISWLKCLKERYTWKPSDEQIKVCKEVYADILSAKGFDLGTVNSELNRLEEELKKLK